MTASDVTAARTESVERFYYSSDIVQSHVLSPIEFVHWKGMFGVGPLGSIRREIRSYDKRSLVWIALIQGKVIFRPLITIHTHGGREPTICSNPIGRVDTEGYLSALS